MELAAAVLSAKMASLISNEMELPDLKHYFWTDSKVVLSYLKNESRRFKTYVANRIQQIKNKTNIEDWHYVKSSENPADIASRGLSPDESRKIDFWFNGPKFLLQSDFHWKSTTIANEVNVEDPELKKVNVTKSTTSYQPNVFLKPVSNISCWNRMKRIVAKVIQAVDRMRRKERVNTLSIKQLNRAEVIVIKAVQEVEFDSEISLLKTSGAVSSKSNVASLNPFLDINGLIRVGGRLQHSELEFEVKHPVLLPKKNKLTNAIIYWCHIRVGHGGRGATLNEIRQQGFWIVNGNSNVRSIIFKCTTCRYLRGRVGEQIMGNLPKYRMTEAPPFSYCGVDFFGPFLVRQGRKDLKRYGAIFSCFASRAVHLEVASNLETDTFILALRRFIGRRGNVRTIRSDNGTNFVGAENELRQAVQEFDNEKIAYYLNELGADWEWNFNPPAASHMGGTWERQIRSIRNILSSLLKTHGQSLDHESLETLIVETEAIVNSRPLTVDGLSDANSLSALSPINLLTMKSKVVLPPPGNFSPVGVYTRKRWRRVQHIANEFWCRWRKEYLQQLQSRTKWQSKRRNFEAGDIVLLKDSTLIEIRNTWPMAKIVRTFAGKDGFVRCADVYVSRSKSILRRPISKLILLVENESIPAEGSLDG